MWIRWAAPNTAAHLARTIYALTNVTGRATAQRAGSAVGEGLRV
jgi:hypothetical protein